MKGGLFSTAPAGLCLIAAMGAVLWCGACSDGATNSCGPGTVLQAGRCVVTDAVACGPGTVLIDATCVAASDGSASGSTDGTTNSDNAGEDIDAGDGASESGDGVIPSDGGCVPACLGRQCGDDGCGGSCGTCTTAAKPNCDATTGQCVATCVPLCMGKDCGDDGCGGNCGTCSGGLNCSTIGRCVPLAWTCPPAAYNGGTDSCDCGCGAPDPDCKNPLNLVAGCKSTQICSAAGVCADKAPASWTCAPTAYAGLDDCNCGCGAADPDCDLGLPLWGCKVGETCSATGNCVACKPSCAGKVCGDDGCGGSCGTCQDPTKAACSAGQCVNPCAPKPLACQTNACGDNGCGGSCGTCASGWACQDGNCTAVALPSAPTSCQGHCGSSAPAGCYCVQGCELDKSCCADFAAVCSCKAKCAGKTCGPDGCGGACGTCPGDKPFCSSVGQCTAACTKQCDGKTCGSDGCGGVCGVCKDGATCSFNSICVPPTWFCPTAYFGDGLACDCGCGAVDPDCANSSLATFGCPSAVDTCTATGICSAKFCGKNSECAPKWCVGSFASGSGFFKGVCATPNALAKAPGQPCLANAECATGVCSAALCALACQFDGDCPVSQTCLGAPIWAPVTGAIVGVAGLCRLVPGSAKACASQAGCPSGESCLPFVDAVTAKARYLCSASKGSANACYPGEMCGNGKVCAPTDAGGLCTIGCPAGAPDCPAKTECAQVSLWGAAISGLAGEPKVAVCMPK